MMVPERAVASTGDFSIIPPDVANAAGRYQRLRAVEAEQLALMARYNLSEEWPPEAREIVLRARDHIQATRAAQAAFRSQVRDFVLALRATRTALPAVLRHARVMMQLLTTSGALVPDDGWLETEVLEWAIEEFEGA